MPIGMGRDPNIGMNANVPAEPAGVANMGRWVSLVALASRVHGRRWCSFAPPGSVGSLFGIRTITSAVR